MSERMVWSADPFLRDTRLDPSDVATVAAQLVRLNQPAEVADMLGLTGDTTA